MDFSRLNFEQVHKSSKKFSKINKETYQLLQEEIETVNFSKIIEEIPKVILEPKFESKDIQYIIEICSQLNQIYPDFDKHYKDSLIKELKLVSETKTEKKSETKIEEEDEKKISRKKNLYKLLIESFLSGLVSEFSLILNLFKRLLTKDKNEFNHFFPILVFLIKNYSEPLFNIKPKIVRKLISKGKINDYEISVPKEIGDTSKYKKGFQEYYYKIILVNLEEKNKLLQELEKKNMDSLSKLESTTDIQEKYTKQRISYMKFLSQVTEFAEAIDGKLPDLINEKFLRVEDSRKAATRVEKINKYDPFSDELEYMFYNKLVDLKEVNEELYEYYNNNANTTSNSTLNDEEQKKKWEAFILMISKCDSKDSCDEAFIEFLTHLNCNKFRKQLPKLFLRGSSKTNYSLLKYYTRFTRNLVPYYKDLKDELVDSLVSDFNNGFNSEKLNNMDERYKNLKFIGEMIKFDMFPINVVLSQILMKLYDDLQSSSIELICVFLESCGRCLYLNEESHLRFNTFLNQFKTTASYKIYYDTRMYNSVLNMIQICKPNEHLLKQKVKVRSIEEEYIRYLLFSELNKENVKKISSILRKMNWSVKEDDSEDEINEENNEIKERKESNLSNKDNKNNNDSKDLKEAIDTLTNNNNSLPISLSQENLIFKYIYKLLIKGKETQSNLACILLIHLKDSHPEIITTITMTLVEELRTCLERFMFEDNQHKMLICNILGRMYSYKLISTDLVFFLLYFILIYSPEWNYGITEFKVDNQYDSNVDFSRILMVVNLLEVSGDYLRKERLYEFVHFFQIYILTKLYLPSDTENRILNCLEYLLGKSLHVYNDFSHAIQDSKRYKGLFENDSKDDKEKGIFNYEENEEHAVHQKVYKIDDENEFDRQEVVKKEEKYDNFNVDNELQKLINEEISKAKNTNTSSTINIEEDLKKNKTKAKDEKETEGKKVFKFITKQNGKAVVTSIQKN